MPSPDPLSTLKTSSSPTLVGLSSKSSLSNPYVTSHSPKPTAYSVSIAPRYVSGNRHLLTEDPPNLATI